jgi:hypothetical protein
VCAPLAASFQVPLLVPLFSDTTRDTTAEMLRIYQENGEVVCCVGSALNVDNTALFGTNRLLA